MFLSKQSTVIIVFIGAMLIVFFVVPTFAKLYTTQVMAPTTHHSPAYYGFNVSNLRNGQKTDSKLVIQDKSTDGWRAIVKGRGCGRTWTKTTSGALGTASRETGCNLSNHTTGEISSSGTTHWGQTSNHPG